MAGTHVCLQQEHIVSLVFLLWVVEKVAQLCYIFGGLPVLYAWVVEATGNENGRVSLVPIFRKSVNVIVRGVGVHVVKYFLLLSRIPPLLKFWDREGDTGIQHCVYHIDKWYFENGSLEEVWSIVNACTDQQATCAGTTNDKLFGACVPLFDQMSGTINEIEESVLLAE